jgi:plastocyanin
MRSFDDLGPPRRPLSAALALALAASLFGRSAGAAPPPAAGPWLGEEMPLPLPVRTPQDLAVKQVAERQYLIFNLLASGKLAWDAGDFLAAAAKWEALLRLHGLDPELERVIRPLAKDARGKAGAPAPSLPVATAGAATVAPAIAAGAPPVATPTPASAAIVTAAPESSARVAVAVSGVISGGGVAGPGGAVIWLKRASGETPRPSPARGKVINQRNKSFIPHVLAVPVGTKVDFRNEDAIFHNVFSLSRPNDFDTGLYKQGASYSQVFRKAGPVQLLCNIHASMIGYVYVVETPYYAQADESGAFNIKGVPPGEYELTVWHEGSSKEFHQKLAVVAEGVRGLAIKIGGDRRPPQFVPDKSGKPRQSHLGY